MATPPPGFVTIEQALLASKGTKLNIIGVVVDIAEARRTTGTDWCKTINICDRTHTNSANGFPIRFFYKGTQGASLECKAGDVVIARRFNRSFFNGKPMAITNFDKSSWTFAVRDAGGARFAGNVRSVSADEAGYSRDLREWWEAHVLAMEDNGKGSRASMGGSESRSAAAAAAAVTRVNSRRKGHQFIEGYEKTFFTGDFIDVVGKVCDVYTGNCDRSGRSVHVFVTDFTSHEKLHEYTMLDENGQPRDADFARKWPLGKYVMRLILWDGQADRIREVEDELVGQLMHFHNVKIKESPHGELEGSISDDHKYPDKKLFNRWQGGREDDISHAINAKLQEFRKKSAALHSKYFKEVVAKRTREGTAESEVQAARPSKRARSGNGVVKREEKEDEKYKELASTIKAEWEKKYTAPVNPQIIADRPSGIKGPVLYTPLKDIKNLQGSNSEGALPKKYFAKVRVADFFPPNIRDFSRKRAAKTPKPRKNLDADIRDKDTDDSESEVDDLELDTEEREARRWEWKFKLLLEDEDGSWLPVMVNDFGGKQLFKRAAGDLYADDSLFDHAKSKLTTLWGNLGTLRARQLAAAGTEIEAAMERGEPVVEGIVNSAVEEVTGRIRNQFFETCVVLYEVRNEKGELVRECALEGSYIKG